MENLNKILEVLEKNETREKYKIPYSWNYVGAEFEKADDSGEIFVSSRDYFKKSVEFILSYKKQKKDEVNSFYSLFVRCFSAWNHGSVLEGGTFLKTIALLPLVKEMGFNGIYFLPVFELSEENRKGGLTSPYAIKNIMKFDKNLHDSHLNGMTLEEEFSALCQACHKLQMKVVLDFAFRTAARDSDLCCENPDWFYWVKNHKMLTFSAPTCDELGHTVVNEKNVKTLYKSESMDAFSESFSFPPDKEAIKNWCTSENSFFDVCRENLGISVMPGFADTINDPQPPWSDVTFLKYYFDNTENVKKKFGEDFPPMIAQDGIKSSVFGGERPNLELWEYVRGVIPHYIDKYSIDGARIDMAHALPRDLINKIVSDIKDRDKKFLLWSEEFSSDYSENLKNDGYDFYTGGIWDLWDEKSFSGMNFNRRLSENISGSIPVISCTETADTPRSMHTMGLLKCMAATVVTALLPNTVYFVNNAQEFSEKQPMNLGLNNTEKGKYVLPKNHPLYGKLAFFDEFYFDWKNRKHMYEAIKSAMLLRKRYEEVLTSVKNYDLKQLRASSQITTVCGWNGKRGYLLLFNRGNEEIKVYAKKCVPNAASLGECIYGCENKDVLYPNSVIVYDLENKNTTNRQKCLD